MIVRLTISPRARSDMAEIWKYTSTQWGADQADAYIRSITRLITRIGQQPTLGRACPEIKAEYYKLRCGSHVLFFRLLDSEIDIARILHQRIDYVAHLDED